MNREIERQTAEQELAQRRKEDLERELEILDGRKKEMTLSWCKARVSLEQLDSTRMIAEERRKLEGLEAEKRTLMTLCRKLEHFQAVVSELMNQFFEKEKRMEDQNVLASLCGPRAHGCGKGGGSIQVQTENKRVLRRTGDESGRYREGAGRTEPESGRAAPDHRGL